MLSKAPGNSAEMSIGHPQRAWPVCSSRCGGRYRSGEKEVLWAREKARLRDRGEGPGTERCRPDSELLDSPQMLCRQTGAGGTAGPLGTRAHTVPAGSASPACW